MRLTSEIKKDARIFYREGRTVTLLIIVPIIMMIVLNAVFGRATGDPRLNIKIGFCDLDKTNFSRDFIAGIDNSSVADMTQDTQCTELAINSVSTGKLSAAVVIPQGFEDGIKTGKVQEIKLILDNTRIQTAPSIESFFRASASASSQNLSIEYVSVIWKKLRDADKQLSQLKDEIEKTNDKAADIALKLNQTKAGLGSIDFDVMSNALNGANGTIQDAVFSLQAANDNLTVIKSKFKNYDDTLAQSENDLTNISSITTDLANNVSNFSQELNCTISNNSGFCGTINNINNTVGGLKANISDRLLKIKMARRDLNDTNKTVESFRSKINASLGGVGSAQQKISDLNNFVDTLKKNRQDALSTISDAQNATILLLGKISEMSSLIDDAKKQIKEITSREPIAVVSPINLNTQNVFEKKTFFEFLLPGLVPMIMMFLSLFLSSTSLVREKAAGTLERVFVSQISSIEYSLIKTISYAIVLFPQLVILILMSSLLYGAFSILNFEILFNVVLIGLLIMIFFNAVGFVIAAFSDSEATAFLASLVIGLPLLFMSGLIFPFDFMPSFMIGIGEANPLSQGIIGMQSAIAYNTPSTIVVPNLAAYVIIAIICSVFAINKKMRG